MSVIKYKKACKYFCQRLFHWEIYFTIYRGSSSKIKYSFQAIERLKELSELFTVKILFFKINEYLCNPI